MSQIVKLGRLGDVPDGQSRGFDPLGEGRDTVFVVRQGQMLHGWLDRCPHEGQTPLPYRRHRYLNAKGNRIVCFAHGAQFDIATGQGVSGPCVGMALSPAKITVTSEGEIRADMPGSPTCHAANAAVAPTEGLRS